MNRSLATAMTAVLLSGGMALADPFDDAMAANKRGDYFTSFPLFEKLALRGDAAAQTSLGLMLEKGQGVAPSPAEAVQWYRLAAEQGYATAQVNLGLMYGKGLGVAQDEVRAYMWFMLAAGSGEPNAIRNRNVAAQRLTPQQIAQALQMARECQRREFRGCE
ncbi:MAG TPA: tetratricopeptide repeat protein [Burkholderiaceae bacterium]|nr:tetratricopeptide repeat protein [Burkholderiaceae bacterium]